MLDGRHLRSQKSSAKATRNYLPHSRLRGNERPLLPLSQPISKAIGTPAPITFIDLDATVMLALGTTGIANR